MSVFVAVAAVDALGGVEFVIALELDAGDLFRDVDELVDGDELVGAEVEWLVDVALGDHLRALGAVVDVHEGAGLFSIAPDLDLDCLPECLASMTLRQTAAGAFSRPPVHVPSGP